METLRITDEKRAGEMKIYDKIFNMLSFEKITFVGKLAAVNFSQPTVTNIFDNLGLKR